jgi:hypothetical protein
MHYYGNLLGGTVEGMMGGIVRCGVDKKLLNSAILMKSLDLSKGKTYTLYNESAETSSEINGMASRVTRECGRCCGCKVEEIY